MDKLLLLFSVLSLGGCIYFFFIDINLLYGAVLYIASILFGIVFAMKSTVNKLPDDHRIEE